MTTIEFLDHAIDRLASGLIVEYELALTETRDILHKAGVDVKNVDEDAFEVELDLYDDPCNCKSPEERARRLIGVRAYLASR